MLRCCPSLVANRHWDAVIRHAIRKSWKSPKPKELINVQVEILDGHRDLEMGEWAVAEKSEILETGGASTCGIVAVLNHTQERAWMVHQTAPHTLLADTEEMLCDASAEMKDGDDIVVFLAGCGPGPTQEIDQQALVKLVTARFPDMARKVHWGKEALVLEFDSSAGKWASSFE